MKFSIYHQWLIHESSSLIKMGITPFVKNFLGEFSYFSLPEKTYYLQDETIFSIESSKTVWDFQAPFNLTLIEHNIEFFNNPKASDPFNHFLFRIETESSLDTLFDQKGYEQFIGEQL